MRCSVTESHLIALTLLRSGKPLRHASINGVSRRSGLWCEETRDVVHEVLVHECFRDRRPGRMRGLGLGLGTFGGHIAVQIPMMHLHQRHALVSAVQGLEARREFDGEVTTALACSELTTKGKKENPAALLYPTVPHCTPLYPTLPNTTICSNAAGRFIPAYRTGRRKRRSKGT